MDRKLIFIGILFISSSCEQSDKINNENKTIISPYSNVKVLEEKTSHSPLFLGLSPHMNDDEFDNRIKQLQEKGNLDGYNFSINNVNFLVKKTKNSIRLDLVETESYSPNNINYQKSENLLLKYKSKKDKILNVYSSKYKRNNVQLPNNIDLTNFKLNKEKYILFKDDAKYILFGYSLPGAIYPSEQERKDAEDAQPKREKLFGEDTFSSGNEIVHYDFGLEIQIDYIDKKDMDKMIDLMIKESQEKNVKHRTSEKEKSRKNAVKVNNINEI